MLAEFQIRNHQSPAQKVLSFIAISAHYLYTYVKTIVSWLIAENKEYLQV